MKHQTIKKIFTVLLIAVFIMTQFSAVFAEETSDASSAKETITEEKEPKAEPEEEKKEEPQEEVKEEPAVEETVVEEEPAPEPEVSEEAEEPAAKEVKQEEPSKEETKASEKESSKKDTKAKEKTTSKKKEAAKIRSTSNIDNSTSLKDGLYSADQFEFTFTGGTGKAKFTCERVVVENGKANAVFTASSENMTHVYLGKPDSDAEDKNLYDPSKDQCGTDVYPLENKQVTIPVVLNQEMDFAARSVAMTEPHWISYKYTITISEEAESIDNATTIKDGTYKPDDFSFTGGTGKAKLTCDKVIIKDGRALAVFTASSENMTHAYMGKAASNNEDVSLYDPVTNKCGNNVYPITSKQVTVPVQLNKEKDIAVRTTAMTEPHWVNYTYMITLSDSSEKIDDDSTEPPKPSDDPKKDDPVTPSTKQKLSNGTYKVKSTTDRKMFYLYPKETDPAYSILVVKGKKMTATITLTGDGYDYVYMGTPAQAKKAGKANWIKGKIVNGYYTFKIPVSALDKKLAITPHSKKYESDNDPSTEPWRPDKWIIFYSAKAVKVKDGTSSTAADAKKKKKDDDYATSGKQTKFKNDKKKDKVSKWKDDSSGSTHAVNNKTTLKDGVYTPDSFSWSGGSGRLAYIRCNKITVTGGKAYATIEFGSSKYDSLRANGRVYSKSGGGNSKFVIPVKLNGNNTIIGRTTAMSSPHWIKYNIYIGKAETKAAAKKMQAAKKEAAKAKVKLTEKAPEIPGLTYKSTTEVKYAKYFKLFNYDQGVTLLSIDLTTKTALKEEYTKNAQKALEQSDKEDDVEYDEEGNVIARSDNERIEALYHNNVINYLLVPKKFEVPAGLEKEYIVIRIPAKNTYIASHQVIDFMDQLDQIDRISLIGVDEKKVNSKDLLKALKDEKVQAAGSYVKPEYAKMLKAKVKFTTLPASSLPKEIKESKSILKKTNKEELQAKAAEKQEALERAESRFTALGVPVLIDRSSHEKSKLAKAEWIKVYGAIYHCEKDAEKLFNKEVKESKQ